VGRSSCPGARGEARKEVERGVYAGGSRPWGRGEGVVETWQNGPEFVSY
jgi:hypothetical protein